MATMDYVEIPSYATRLQSNVSSSSNVRPATKITTSLPNPESSPVLSPLSAGLPSPPAKGPLALNLPQILLSTLPNPPPAPRNAATGAPQGQLLSTRDPLSIPITSVNFRRFVSKSGPIFWLQDRIEEVVMWRKGWKVTGVWMSAYAFLCYFPRLILLLPHAVLLGILLVNHPSRKSGSASVRDNDSTIPPPPSSAGEGSVDWLANLQAIQNLMGFVSDAHDFVYPVVPHLTYSTPSTYPLLAFTTISFLLLLPLVSLLPVRPMFLVLGMAPFLVTHPFVRARIYPLVRAFLSLSPSSPAPLPQHIVQSRKHIYTTIIRALDDDRLEDRHWRSELREVELWENERWSGSASIGSDENSAAVLGTWSKTNLRATDRSAWTRGRDGWGGMQMDGSGDVSSNLTFSLAPGWAFVETEDWRPDIEASWAPAGSDDHGWVYTNDAWQDPRPAPLEGWQAGGVTRRRRWVRRIYYNPALSV
ncbi:hypothetical protein GLOTRDRAFT_111255 [Gloeophyllum trabeum ATCC 11539]|uniref:TECPR1-like DysF domain-containing protein n=1 Tax=Gloeophyllum trabeum (strain ATCC 11539 / FP-39264 / Madison 617) TaxID=670483 RepID=S7RNS3_GLOTA|nr:uncharacterized protein GLOTRDRAFT_111255 [Gloeophyllum trabeum ATCC 11539]EPQ54424.1 hypothetical protein GLOTRDRAFT_111255 [Gloeophyllum trabeum ATCC 11539]